MISLETNGICKALGKEQIVTVIIAFFAIIVNFGSLYMMIDFDWGVYAYIYPMVIANLGIAISQLFVIYRTDLETVADV